MAFTLSISGQHRPIYPAENSSFRQAEAYQENVHVHTDRDWYITGETLWCSIYVTHAQTGQLSLLSRVAYLELLDPSGKPAWQAMVRVDSGRGAASWNIPSSLQTAGYTLRAYTRWMRNQPEQSFFRQSLYIVHPKKKPITASTDFNSPAPAISLQPTVVQSSPASLLFVHTDANSYSLRSPVLVTVQAKDPGGKPLATTLSIAVTRIGKEAGNPLGQTQHGMVAGNDVRTGNTALPEAHMAAATEVSSPDRAGRPGHVPEPAGPVASARVQHKITGRPVPGIWVSLSVPGNRFQVAIARSDADGKAMFPLELQEGSGVLAYAFLDDSRDSLMLAPLSMFEDRPSAPLASSWQFSPEELRTEIEAQLPEVQLAQAFQQTSLGPMLVRDKDDTTAFFGVPDRAYQLDDYVRFTTMEEVFREYVREVEVRKSKADYRLRVLNAPMRSFFTEDPLVLLDGVPIRDINRVMRFDPLKLRSIEIITRRYYLGGQGFPGILVLRTYQGDLGGIDLPEDVLVTEFSGLLPPHAFSAPDYTGQSGTRTPDLRRSLYWAPKVDCRSAEPCAIRFFTGDVPGRYRVSVHALTTDGHHLESSAIFEVR